MQGCPIKCPGCQNHHLWSNRGGTLEHESDVAHTLAMLAAPHGNVTISGGDPFAQPLALLALVLALREHEAVKHIIAYTGYRWEDLISNLHAASAVLRFIDVLVDGPFIREMDDPLIAWRGSRNQRPIDVQASIDAGHVVALDWDNPEIVISAEGSAFMPVGLIPEFQEIGSVQNTRRCGQTK
jgi:anaerobic ribonucleoside-triphosphate reductase activating protein